MTSIRSFSLARGVTALLLALLLSACNAADRISRIGAEPPMSAIENPSAIAAPQQIAMPMPPPSEGTRQANSLWRTGNRTFFKDQRASTIGDILTVVIQIDDEAQLDNTSSRSRNSGENASMPSLLGLESKLGNLFPEAVNPSSLVEFGADSTVEGTGRISRTEEINLRVAAMVTQVLPNGNLVIAGRQETRVNYELRQLQIAGIVRPEDVTSLNEISFDQIAEARIAYGGKGHISDVQQPRYGQQLYDIIWPF